MADAPRLLIWVQHLLGIGHVARAATLARHFAAAGWEVEFASGGPPVDDLDIGSATLRQLPPLRSADAAFSRLVAADGSADVDIIFARRRAGLVNLVHLFGPDIVLVEHFPFGRRAFRGEITAAIAAAREHGAKIVCSVRDILVARRPKRAEESAAIIEHEFDLVLVHGDDRLITLGETFPLADRIADRIRYTGYIGGAPVAKGRPGDDGWGEVIVSAGGGAVGARIVETALEAAGRCGDAGADGVPRWRVLIGQATLRADIERLRKGAPERAIVERARPDFRQLLANAAVSVSQAGYNTVVDILQAGAPAVVIPFATDTETEQTLRAQKLAALGRVQVIGEAALTPDALLGAITVARAAPPPDVPIALDGERTTERLLRGLLAAA